MSWFYTSAERSGKFILFRGYEHGRPVKRKIEYRPTLYLPSPEPTEFRTLQGKFVAPFQPGTMGECYKFCEEYKDVEGMSVYGNQNYVHQFLSDNFLDEINWDRSLVDVTSIDIEVQSDQGFPQPAEAKFPINAITLRSSRDGVYYCWGLGDYDPAKSVVKDAKIVYKKCEDESDLLSLFMLHWSKRYPDVLTGWNSRLFDTVYLINRIKRLHGEGLANAFSPWGTLRLSEIEIGGKTHPIYDIVGIQQLDYLDLFKKFGYTYGTQENYKLNTIASTVLGEKKIDYSDYGHIRDLMTGEFEVSQDEDVDPGGVRHLGKLRSLIKQRLLK